jgi:hypothetical protein
VCPSYIPYFKITYLFGIWTRFLVQCWIINIIFLLSRVTTWSLLDTVGELDWSFDKYSRVEACHRHTPSLWRYHFAFFSKTLDSSKHCSVLCCYSTSTYLYLWDWRFMMIFKYCMLKNIMEKLLYVLCYSTLIIAYIISCSCDATEKQLFKLLVPMGSFLFVVVVTSIYQDNSYKRKLKTAVLYFVYITTNRKRMMIWIDPQKENNKTNYIVRNILL